MRSKTRFLWGQEPDPTTAVLDQWLGPQRTAPTTQDGRYAVEVCWIADGVVTCRTYRVSATTEVRAARVACRKARHSLIERATRIEAVYIEQLQRGDGHE